MCMPGPFRLSVKLTASESYVISEILDEVHAAMSASGVKLLIGEGLNQDTLLQ